MDCCLFNFAIIAGLPCASKRGCQNDVAFYANHSEAYIVHIPSVVMLHRGIEVDMAKISLPQDVAIRMSG